MRAGYKFLVILGLTIALLIPVTMIRGTVQERQSYRAEAVREVQQSIAGEQVVAGPVVIVPYTDVHVVRQRDAGGSERHEEQITRGQWIIFPELLEVEGTIRPIPRKRGLYEVRTYEMDTGVRASFRSTIPPAEDPSTQRGFGSPLLGIGMSDVRGLVGAPVLRVAGKQVPLQQGLGYRNRSGLHATLSPVVAGQTMTFVVEFTASLQGTEALSIMPIAGRSVVRLASSWPHPLFHGDFLPRTREISGKGFRAEWDISSLATDAQSAFTRAKEDANAASGLISVSLVDPVNVYSQVDRATKYAMLFVILTFVAFLIFEFLAELRIHPIQYGLVGLAVSIFFLLLLALSEHVEFVLSYVVAAVACVALIAYYVVHVLGGWKRGLGFTAMLGTLYAALYGLLISEDNAMVLGAALLFLVLTSLMVVTRKVDWYRATSP